MRRPSRFFNKPDGYAPIDHKAIFVARFGRDKVFVKFTNFPLPKDNPDLKGRLRMEKIALKVLQGLAVPEPVHVPAPTLRWMIDAPPLHFVTQRYVEGQPPHELGLSLTQSVAAWMFVVEQLVAFRRRQILYVDVKSKNLVGTAKPLRMTIVDFDRVMLVSPRDSYVTSQVAMTPGYAAPEHAQLPRLQERTLVFPVGILFINLAYEMGTSANAFGPNGFLVKLTKRLVRAGMPRLARLLEECVATDPKRRPKSYEAVWARVRDLIETELPARVVYAWESLRAPYVEGLALNDL
ncbi:MAG: hypothetical protein U0174_14980 [Polyangiaceae bacterium]